MSLFCALVPNELKKNFMAIRIYVNGDPDVPKSTVVPRFIKLMLPAMMMIALGISCKKDFTSVVTKPVEVIPHPDKPNIILIIGDDVGYDVPTFFGGRSYSTPNLDYLAENGMTFSHFHSQPDGFPSRLQILTGKYNYRNFIRWGYIPTEDKVMGNMMQDNGYSTCYVGKWQNDGGDASIKAHGFQNYLVFLPFSDNQRISRYKTPHIYQDGAYLPKSQVKNKYSEDLFSDYLFDFIDSNINKPFFAIYANNLIAGPYVPTPDDPQYADWKTKDENKYDDPAKYNPSMVAYMDKKIGQLVQKITAAGLADNTLIMFCGDNATWTGITSVYHDNVTGRDTTIRGTKTTTTWRGITNPVIAYWPGKIAPGSVSDALMDYTDFIPTFAEVIKTSVPEYLQPTDGVSFYHNLLGTTGTNKDYIKVYWNNGLASDGETDSVPPEVFVFDYDYKLYDDSTHFGVTEAHRYDRFYDLHANRDEVPGQELKDEDLTPEQAAKKEEFIAILKTMRR